MSPNEIHLGSCFVLLEDELGKQIFQKVKILRPTFWGLKICDLSSWLVDPEFSHLKTKLVGVISQSFEFWVWQSFRQRKLKWEWIVNSVGSEMDLWHGPILGYQGSGEKTRKIGTAWWKLNGLIITNQRKPTNQQKMRCRMTDTHQSWHLSKMTSNYAHGINNIFLHTRKQRD